MTESEAIKELQDNIDLPFGFTVSDEASIMAINALEKQIPKKPKMRHLKPYDSYNDGQCPNCKAYVNEDSGNNYCPNCAQKLDWEN